MYQFSRQKILPLFLQRQISTKQLAHEAGISHRTATRAVNGLPITARVVDKIARALDFDAMTFLDSPARITD